MPLTGSWPLAGRRLHSCQSHLADRRHAGQGSRAVQDIYTLLRQGVRKPLKAAGYNVFARRMRTPRGVAMVTVLARTDRS
jgi:hypothetical protein